jgi:hypothetical protein
VDDAAREPALTNENALDRERAPVFVELGLRCERP